MNFTSRDTMLLVSMSIAVIFMSFTFPALGLGNGQDSVNATSIPEFNTTSGQYNLVGEFPESPGTPSTGYVEWKENINNNDQMRWITGDTSGGTQITTYNDTDSGAVIIIGEWDGDNLVGEDRYRATGLGQTFSHTNNSWDIFLNVTEYENHEMSNYSYRVDYEVNQKGGIAGEGGWIQSIPVVGGLASGVGAAAQWMGYISAILFWTLGTIFEVIILMITLIVEITFFLFGLMHWLLSTYFGLITNAPSFAGVFVMIPGIILFVEFAKLVMVTVKLLPTT